MKKIVKLTESELISLIKKVVKEQTTVETEMNRLKSCLQKQGVTNFAPTTQCEAFIEAVVKELPKIDPRNPDPKKIPSLASLFASCSTSIPFTFPPDPKIGTDIMKLLTSLPAAIQCAKGPMS